MEIKLDQNQYNESDLVSVKIRYPLPYIVNSSNFERWNGEVNIDGILYKYVKRRFINDSIEFLCIRDQMSMQLQTARDNFFRLANDLQQNQENKKSDQSNIPSFKNTLNQYYEEIPEWGLSTIETPLLYNPYYLPLYTNFYLETTGQPPDVA